MKGCEIVEKEVKILNGGLLPSDATKLKILHKDEVVLSLKELQDRFEILEKKVNELTTGENLLNQLDKIIRDK